MRDPRTGGERGSATCRCCSARARRKRAGELLKRFSTASRSWRPHVSYSAQSRGGSGVWNVYMDGRVEVLPAGARGRDRHGDGWRRSSRQERGLLGRAIKVGGPPPLGMAYARASPTRLWHSREGAGRLSAVGWSRAGAAFVSGPTRQAGPARSASWTSVRARFAATSSAPGGQEFTSSAAATRWPTGCGRARSSMRRRPSLDPGRDPRGRAAGRRAAARVWCGGQRRPAPVRLASGVDVQSATAAG